MKILYALINAKKYEEKGHACMWEQSRVSFFSCDETYTKGRIIEVFLEKVFGFYNHRELSYSR